MFKHYFPEQRSYVSFFYLHGKTTMLFLPVTLYFDIFIDIPPAEETRAVFRATRNLEYFARSR